MLLVGVVRVTGAGGLWGIALAAGFVVLMLLLAACVPLPAVQGERILPPQPARAGEAVRVRVRLRWAYPAPWLVLRVQDDGWPLQAQCWPVARQALDLTYTVPAIPRGLHPFRALRLTFGDPFGLIRRQVVVDLPATLEVWPRPLPWTPDAVRRRVPGVVDAGDLAGVRPFQSGDRAARIHWPATARRGEVVVRRLEAAAHGVLEVRVTGEGGATATEAALARAAGALLWGHRHRIGLALTVAGASGGTLGPGRGPAHLGRLMRLLAAQPAGELRVDLRPASGAVRPRV